MRLGALVKSIVVVGVVVSLFGCSDHTTGSGRVAAQPEQEEGALLAPPTNLVCESSNPDVFLAWQNGESYDEIRVSRDGVTVGMLAGTAESASDTVDAPGAFTYSVVGVGTNGGTSEPACCEVVVSQLPLLEDVACEVDLEEDAVRLTWSLPAGITFDGIRISRNGTGIAELNGQAVAYADENPPAGAHLYELRGILGVHATEAATCQIAFAVPAAIQSLTGAIDRGSGDFLLEWKNGDSYDEIVVTCGGEEVARLDGSATSFRFTAEAFGVYGFGIQGVRGDCESESAGWEGRIGQLQWNSTASEVVAGYHVYVWPVNGSTPTEDAPFLTVSAENVLPLADLLAAGLLPECREPQAYNIAIMAFDERGNTSDLSTPLTFLWQVLFEDQLL